jgi:Sulfotransferase family
MGGGSGVYSGPPVRQGAPILVTGSHRSGTTWVGQVLMSSGELGYIDEPFHATLTPRSMARRPRYWFEYVGEHNAGEVAPALTLALRYRYPVLAQRDDVRSPRAAALTARNWLRAQRYRVERRRPLVKDPIALFATEWLADEYGIRPILLVRHPAAFVSSVTRLKWGFDWGQWLRDERLMSDLLAEHRSEIERHAAGPVPPVESAAFLWTVLYGVVLRYRERHPEWHVARHEDLSLEPGPGFRAIFDYAQLDWSPRVEQVIRETTSGDNPSDVAVKDYKAVRLNSQAAVSSWRRRLSDDDVRTIRRITEPVAGEFYTSADWA